jgi:MoaA/NifB/PqqE/SkfB family radical SAM enzyme
MIKDEPETTTLRNVFNALDPKLTAVFLPWALRHPRYLRTFIRLIGSYKHANRLRKDAKLEDLTVPPFLILSITSQCNLQCIGCYATTTIPHKNSTTSERTIYTLDIKQWRAIIAEACALGVFGFIIAGGEPFLFPGLLELCEEFKNSFFLIITNGTALTEMDFKRLKRLSNVAIIVSVEGGREITETRRGKGVYDIASNTLQRLNKVGILAGISVTINRLNYNYWMDSKHLDDLIAQGVCIGIFIEHIPTTSSPKDDGEKNVCNLKQFASLCPSISDVAAMKDNIKKSLEDEYAFILTKEEREKFRTQILNYRATKPIYIVHSPGDEEYFGGCVSAGRGFAHITPTGDLTPCPVSNIATHNLTKTSLREALASPLFEKIRENQHLLEMGDTPCALFAHPKEVDELAKCVGAYHT